MVRSVRTALEGIFALILVGATPVYNITDVRTSLKETGLYFCLHSTCNIISILAHQIIQQHQAVHDAYVWIV